MSPAYLYELADLADPDKLWRLSGIDQRKLPDEKRRQIDAGVALRRHACYLEELAEALARGQSLCVTPMVHVNTTDVDFIKLSPRLKRRLKEMAR